MSIKSTENNHKIYLLRCVTHSVCNKVIHVFYIPVHCTIVLYNYHFPVDLPNNNNNNTKKSIQLSEVICT